MKNLLQLAVKHVFVCLLIDMLHAIAYLFWVR